ncbi:serine/threonine-protein kinase [Streptomyces fimicarius]|uniref:serine/threonine-protein kinase n=1 Tax=Streptomyces griseus TaxID=1911 RepID=UPI0036879D65
MGHGADGGGLPDRIGGYAVERELGAGGMGTVYLARSRGGRAVAVKVARPELAGDPHFRERFRAEVAAARSVGGFHTAPVVDADPEAAAPWLATAYVPGPTLAALVEAEGPMDETRLRQLGAALAEALAAIHGCGLVHRDLKPGNIIMAPDGPRVLDFGIARALESTRLTATGTAFGTPGFLAPEQAQGQDISGAADVFALGAVLVAAAGGSAFGAGTPMGMMYRSVHEPPDLAAVPEGLRPVLAACLAKEPEQRPTPTGLLDLFVPDDSADSAASPAAPYSPYAPTVAVAPTGGVPDDIDLTFVAVGPGSSLLVDETGVTLGPENAEVHYTWAEISTVTYQAAGPKHLQVVVHLHHGAAHPCLLAARRRSRLQAWLDDLPLALECFG